MLQGVKNAQEEYRAFGIEVSIKMPITLEPAEQIGILNELELEGVSGIAVFPLNDASVKDKINQLIDKGIAIITFNSHTEGTRDFCFVGQDHEKGGRTAAGLMSKVLQDNDKVGIIISSYKLSCHQDRLKGFTEKISELTKNISILEVQENQDRKEEGFKITLEYCNQHSDLKGIYITGGGIAGVEKNGTVDFALGQSPELQGYQLVKILFEYLVKKQSPVSEHFEIPITIATPDSL